MPALDHERKVRNLVRAITESDLISDRNRKLIMSFKRDMSINDMSHAWIQNLLSRLKIMAQTANFDFDKATKNDIKNLIEQIKKRPIQPRTVVDYKKGNCLAGYGLGHLLVGVWSLFFPGLYYGHYGL